MHLLSRLFLCLLLLSSLACGVKDRLANKTPGDLYQLATEAYADDDYQEAYTILDRLRDDFPFSRFAVEAELLTADVKFREELFQEAAAAYRSFEQLHPTHPKVAYAIYQRGLAYWELSHPAGLDQSPSRDAAEAFQKLLYGYPDDELAPAAREHLATVRSRLAAHELHVAKYYQRRKGYPAALGRLEVLIREYPDTPQRDEALQLALEIKSHLAQAEP